MPGSLAALLLCALALSASLVHAADSWDAYSDGVQNMRIGAASVGKSLGPVMDWEYDGSLESIRRGQAFIGPSRRLRRVAADWLAGKPVEVAILGGSISTGVRAGRHRVTVPAAAADPKTCGSAPAGWLPARNPAAARLRPSPRWIAAPWCLRQHGRLGVAAPKL